MINQYKRAQKLISNLAEEKVIEYFKLDVYEMALEVIENNSEDVIKEILDEIEADEKSNPKEYQVNRIKTTIYQARQILTADSATKAIALAEDNVEWEELSEENNYEAEEV